jgi:hypothetical protein
MKQNLKRLLSFFMIANTPETIGFVDFWGRIPFVCAVLVFGTRTVHADSPPSPSDQYVRGISGHGEVVLVISGVAALLIYLKIRSRGGK